MRIWPFLTILITFIVIPFTIFSQVDLNSGLLAYYPFSGNANDASGNGNNPIFNNATLTVDYYGNANSAYYFNGVDNYMEILNNESLNPKELTLCAMVNVQGFYYGNCYNNCIIDKGTSDGEAGNYSLRFTQSAITNGSCGIQDTINQQFVGYAYNNSTAGLYNPPVQKNVWTCVVYTVSADSLKLYVGGNLVWKEKKTSDIGSNSYNVFLGRKGDDSFPYWFNGVMDEVRIYNRALTPGEVSAYSVTCVDKTPCNNWLQVNQEISGVQIGDLDVQGDQITVEAIINRDTPYPELFDGGDVVSKHDSPDDANFLLRPTVAQITTTNGFFETERACQIELNKTYHIAMVYNGRTLRFYRNGFLMSEVPASGNLYQNDWLTKIGTTANTGSPYPADFIGYINEVRIWNVARSQTDIQQYMDQSLPNPASQSGLLAYYTFDDLKNKQGNSNWDGSILGEAQINETNPTCSSFVADSCDTEICDVKADFNYAQITCNPKSVQLHNISFNADSTWWDFGNGQTAANVKDTVIQYADFGTYTVQLFAKTNSGCLDTAIYTVNVQLVKDSAITVSDTSICAGSSIQLNTIRGLDYCWSPAAGLSNPFIQYPLATPAVTTTYYLNILTDSTQPVIQDSITITVIPPPAVSAGSDVAVCLGDSVQLIASGAFTYIWASSPYLSDTTIATPIAKPISTTDFVVKGFDIYGCTNIDTVRVTVWSLPGISITSDTAVCTGGSVMLMATSPGNNTYNWMPSTGLSDPTIFNPVSSPGVPTKYFVQVIDSNQCSARDSVMVDVLPLPVVSTIADTGICLNNSIALTTTMTNASILSWSPSSGLNDPAILSPQASPVTSTQYTVVAGNGICSTKDSVLVSVLNLPDVRAGNDTIVCGNASAQLNATGAVSYIWSPAAGLSDPNIPDPVATPGETTMYRVTGTGSNACINTDSVLVTSRPPATFTLVPQTTAICAGDSVLLTATGGDAYNWMPDQFITNTSGETTTAFPAVSTTYQAVITNSECKVTDTLTTVITVNTLPDIRIGKSNDIDCINTWAQLTASGAATYVWSPISNISNPYISNPIANPGTDTWYSVTGKSGNGCSNTDSVLVKVLYDPAGTRFDIPSAFTPNHDGLNDCFGVKYWGQADVFDMSVYNRWGQVIFHSNKINACWDGNYKGFPQKAGTYVYQINISSPCSNGLVQKKGTIVLIR